jgi:hypothetical protein
VYGTKKERRRPDRDRDDRPRAVSRSKSRPMAADPVIAAT